MESDVAASAPGPRGGAGRWIGIGSWIALIALATAFSLQTIRSLDYWWHLRAGTLIHETGSVPKVDPFSFTAEGARWIDVHWLHQLGLHALFRIGGHEAVVLGKVALILATVALLAGAIRRWDRPVVVAVAIALGLATLSDRIMPRPEVPTFVLLAALLAVLERHRRHEDAWIYAVVPIQLVWANVHGLFAVGLGVIAMAVVGSAFDAIRAGRFAEQRPALLHLCAAGALSTLASLANPNGLDTLLYPFQQFLMVGSPEMRDSVGLGSAELASLVTQWWRVDATVLAGFVLLAGASALALVLNLRRAPGFDFLALAAFGLLALLAMRNLGLFGVVAPLVLARNAAEWLDRREIPAAVERPASIGAVLAIAGLALAVGTGRWGLWTGNAREPGLGVFEPLYPIEAAEWIAREAPPGPIYHHMADGGYLIWRLWPDHRVMVDGRLEVYGARLTELNDESPAMFRKLDARHRFGSVLLNYAFFDFAELIAWLRRQPDWRLAHVDSVAVVFARRDSSRPRQPDLDVSADDLFPPLGDERGVRDLMERQARARFYLSMGRRMQGSEIVDEIRRRYPAFSGR